MPRIPRYANPTLILGTVERSIELEGLVKTTAVNSGRAYKDPRRANTGLNRVNYGVRRRNLGLKVRRQIGSRK